MINILDFNIFFILLILLTITVLYRYYGLVIHKIQKKVNLKNSGMQFFTTELALIMFNVCFMLLLKINILKRLSFINFHMGLIFLIIGIIFAIMIAFLSYNLMKDGSHGKAYQKMVQKSPFFIFISLLLLVGFAEDLLFIGIIQNVLTTKIGWCAIIVYLFIFVFYHYFNVLIGAETKKEFLGMLPVRLIISLIISLSFHFTKTLIYGIIIHNLFDTLSFIGTYVAINNKKKESC